MSTTEQRAEAGIAAGSPVPELQPVLDRLRQSFLEDGPPGIAIRRNRIDRLMALVLDNTDAFVDAMVADFGSRSRTATLMTEIFGMVSVIEHTRSHVGQWMRPTKLMRAGRLVGLHAEVQPTPLGVVGIVGPWNYPLNLVILPAATAFAAGNRVMIKMSEVTANTAELLKSLAPKYFDDTELVVVTGGPDVAAAFVSLPFDHIFFTGSPAVGKLVQRAAAENLVPVTLELGGKNPVVVAPDADIARSAARIARGRMVNGGQVCVCPDYVFVREDKVDEFVDVVHKTFREMFPTVLDNDDYSSNVNQANYDRVVGLLEDARALGARIESATPDGETLPDARTRKIAPTVVRNIDARMKIADEEIFGPVLVVMAYSTLSEAIDHVNRGPAPLVAYWFGPDGHDFREFVRSTRSGAVARNDFAIHMMPSDAPFGGVGNSGMGAYHGKTGFDTFSHQRSVVGTDVRFTITTAVATPPFGGLMRRFGDLSIASVRRRTHRRLKNDARQSD
ncbi:UNVERIFIED_CONTAM: coniferyl-aldehyde dehydrogenase [Williamsia faeni]